MQWVVVAFSLSSHVHSMYEVDRHIVDENNSTRTMTTSEHIPDPIRLNVTTGIAGEWNNLPASRLLRCGLKYHPCERLSRTVWAIWFHSDGTTRVSGRYYFKFVCQNVTWVDNYLEWNTSSVTSYKSRVVVFCASLPYPPHPFQGTGANLFLQYPWLDSKQCSWVFDSLAWRWSSCRYAVCGVTIK